MKLDTAIPLGGSSLWRWWRSIPTRYMFAAEACFTILLMTYNSAGVPIAVTAMIYKVTIIGGNDNDTDVCHQPVVNETFISKPGEFEWDGMTRTTVIAAGEIGMLLSYLVSARICEIFGTRYIVGFSFLINGGVACLQPTFIRLNVWLYVCVSIIQGLLFGSVVPGFNILFTRWLVGKERMIVAALVFSAQIVGTLISMFTSATIIYLFGWDGIFYLNGILSIPFFVSWMYIVYDSPSKHPRISEEEKKYLMSKTNMDYKIVPRAPWLKIITSLPLWAHIAVSMSTAWINYTISIQLPLYLTKVFHFNIEATSLMSACPHLANLVGNALFAFLSHWLRMKKLLSTLTCYKIFNCIATVGPALMIIIIPQLKCDKVGVMNLLSITMFLNGAYLGGSFMNQLDLSPNYAGSVAAFVSTLSGLIQVGGPLAAGALTNQEDTLTTWSKVFYNSSGISFFPVFLFLFFGSTAQQYWDKLDHNEADTPQRHKKKCVNTISIKFGSKYPQMETVD